MLRIEDGNIYLTKGDTAYLQVDVTFDDGTAYEPFKGDTITLSVKQIQKQLIIYLPRL